MSTGGDTGAIERAVTAHMTRRERPVRPAELYAAVHVGGATPTAVDEAVDALVLVGVIRREDGALYASPALLMLDALGMILA
jgi:hypothetical protein